MQTVHGAFPESCAPNQSRSSGCNCVGGYMWSVLTFIALDLADACTSGRTSHTYKSFQPPSRKCQHLKASPYLPAPYTHDIASSLIYYSFSQKFIESARLVTALFPLPESRFCSYRPPHHDIHTHQHTPASNSNSRQLATRRRHNHHRILRNPRSRARILPNHV